MAQIFKAMRKWHKSQQGYLQQMGTLWLGVMMEAVPSPIQPIEG